MSAAAQPKPDFPLHAGLAEQGKLHALAGEHRLALAYYRQAMRLSVEAGNPEIFFRHYLECAIESLEQIGAYDEVFAYCDKAIGLYEDNPPRDDLTRFDLAHIHQRKAAVLLKAGRREGVAEALNQALALARAAGRPLPLAQRLLRWVDLGLHVEPARVEKEQRRTGYFSVRKDKVDAARAVRLPAEQLGATSTV